MNYDPNILNGPANNFFGDPLFTGLPATVNFNISAIDQTSPTAHIVARAQGFSGVGDTISFSLNGQSLGQVSGNALDSFIFDGSVPTSNLVEGQNTLQITCTVCGPNDFSFFDFVDVVYKRRYVASQNQLIFTTTPDLDTDVQGFASSNIRFFDVTNDRDPVQLTGLITGQNGASFDASLPAYKETVTLAVEDSGLLAPASIVPNNPSTLSTTNHNANLVIISYKDFITQANAWADYRRGQGFSVEVVNIEDVYDEFNYGELSPQSIKDFLLFAKNNWQTTPQYVLLIGDATYDPRLFEGPPRSTNLYLVPTMFVDTLNEETASDDSLVDFNDDGLADMVIGRIPATTSDMVTTALSKTMSFEAQAPTQNLSRGALCHYDNPIGFDFQGMCQRIMATLPAGTTTSLVGRADTNPNAPLVADQNNGRYLVNFSGHGTTGSWQARATSR